MLLKKVMMKNTEQIKRTVKEKYSEIAERDSSLGMSGCCISTSGADSEFCMVDGDYSSLEGYMKDADLGLGCGLPTELAATALKVASTDEVPYRDFFAVVIVLNSKPEKCKMLFALTVRRNC